MLGRKIVLGVLTAMMIFQPMYKVTIQRTDISDAAQYPQPISISKEVVKLAKFYQTKDSRIWKELAEYQALASLKAAKNHGIKPSLLVGLIVAESEGYPFAKSITGAKGLGQISFEQHKERFPQVVNDSDKFDPAVNIDCAAELLRDHLDRFGLRGGLTVYNIGEGAFRRGIRNPRYVAKVLKFQNEFSKFKI